MQFEKSNYHSKDRRYNLYELQNFEPKLEPKFVEKVQELSKSVACMIEARHLTPIYQQDPLAKKKYQLAPQISTLAEFIQKEYNIPLGKKEKFYDEKVPAKWTAFLIGKRKLLTAAHCVCHVGSKKPYSEEELSSMRIVFGFQMNDNNTCKNIFEKKEVYRIKKVLNHRWVSKKEGEKEQVDADWAVIELKRDVEGRFPLALNFSKHISGEVFMLGYPSGLPLKFAGKANIKHMDSDTMTTDISAFKGNSGSPVFDKEGKVISMLIAGNLDYIQDNDYKDTGKTRIRVHYLSLEDIKKKGYEKCQRIRALSISNEKTSYFNILPYVVTLVGIAVSASAFFIGNKKNEDESEENNYSTIDKYFYGS